MNAGHHVCGAVDAVMRALGSHARLDNHEAVSGCSQPMRATVGIALAFAACSLWAPAEASPARPWAGQQADFDFYVLALSWSPTHCADSGVARRDAQQCGVQRRYSFVVHGLWPQFEQGYPRSCQTRQRGPDQATTTAMLGVMPSTRLVRSQWERHGACSGLSAADYFALTRRARAQVRAPATFEAPVRWQTHSVAEIERGFVAANPGMTGRGIAVQARGQLLREVRICLTKALAFRDCPEVDARGEPARVRLSAPPARG